MGVKKEKFTLEEIRTKIKEIEPDVELLSTEYKNNKDPLLFKCPCGKEFVKNWTTIQSKKSCKCRSCSRKKGWKEIRRASTFNDDSIKIFKKNGFNPLEEIKNVRDKVLCIDKDGYKGRISLENIKLNKHFSIFSLKYNKDYLIYNLNNFASLTHTNTIVTDFEEKSRTCDTLIHCICECGNKFTTNICNFTTQDKTRCEKCTDSISNLEFKIKNELEKRNVNFVYQKRFKDCRNPKTNYSLPFDFYLPDYNVCIEVDGKQHFQVSYFGNETKEKAISNLKKTQYRDKIKNEYCASKEIKLVRISYLEFKNSEYNQILNNLFN